jgi:hypothetical protein
MRELHRGHLHLIRVDALVPQQLKRPAADVYTFEHPAKMVWCPSPSPSPSHANTSAPATASAQPSLAEPTP